MDETQVVVRTARAGDADILRRFLIGLSPESQYKRFFTGLGRVAPSVVGNLLALAPRQLALLAVHGDTVVGHVMAVCVGGHAVDVAIVVADERRGTGLGRRLLRELIEILAGLGVDEVHMDVASDNQVMLGWMRRLLPDGRFEWQGPTVAATGSLRVPAAA